MSDLPLPVVTLVIDRTGATLARVEVAATSASRRRGLLGRDSLEPGRGMWIRPCSSVHTWFMRFAIDLVYLDRERTVVGLDPEVPPFTVRWGGLRARETVELPAGAIGALDLRVGDRLRVDPA